MPYGFFVFFRDRRNYTFKYYAQYAATEGEALLDYKLEALERGYKPRALRASPASQEDWMRFERHGDTWHSPNSRFGQAPRKRRGSK